MSRGPCNALVLNLAAYDGGWMVWCRGCRTEQTTTSHATAVDLAAAHQPRWTR